MATTDPAQRQARLWIFMVVGFVLSTTVTILRYAQAPPHDPGQAGSVLLGTCFGGPFWGWIAWLLWTRRRKTAMVVGGVLAAFLVLLIATAPGRRKALRAQEDELFTRGCQTSCEAQGEPAGAQRGLPDKRMFAKQVLCQCSCSGMLEAFSRDERLALSGLAPGAPETELTRSVRERATKVAEHCRQTYLPAAH